MDNYRRHLEEQYSPKTSARKLQYIEYNFGKFLKPGLTVLEVGPGFGEFLEALKRHGITKADVIDRDEDILQYVAARYTIQNAWATSIEQIATIESSLRKYDIIYLSEILEHVRKEAIIDVVRRLYARLNPGGVILIVAPNAGNPLCAVELYADFTHEMAFSVNAFRQIVDAAGISPGHLAVFGYRIPPVTPLNLLRIALQKLLHLCLLWIMVINGANYSRILQPNLCAVIRRPLP
jgi:SAM-dependent methyltransferase